MFIRDRYKTFYDLFFMGDYLSDKGHNGSQLSLGNDISVFVYTVSGGKRTIIFTRDPENLTINTDPTHEFQFDYHTDHLSLKDVKLMIDHNHDLKYRIAKNRIDIKIPVEGLFYDTIFTSDDDDHFSIVDLVVSNDERIDLSIQMLESKCKRIYIL